jgi:hypothetical protein
MVLSKNQSKLVADFYKELKVEKLSDAQIHYEMSQFLRSLGTASRDNELRNNALDKNYIDNLLEKQSET